MPFKKTPIWKAVSAPTSVGLLAAQRSVQQVPGPGPEGFGHDSGSPAGQSQACHSVATCLLKATVLSEPELPHLKIRTVIVLPRDFPGGAVVKNLPTNGRDTGSISGAGRSHVPRHN